MSLAITNSFVAHTTIRSADMNQNFQDIVTWANALGAWSSWTPTITGFSAAPTPTYAIYTTIGKTVIANIRCGNGTSGGGSASIFTISLPVNCSTSDANYLADGPAFPITDSGTGGLGHWRISAGSPTVINIYRMTGTDFASVTPFVAWNITGTKGFVDLWFSYKID